MASLAELLELLYGAHRRVRTARGVVSYRQSMSRMHEAHRREMERVNRRRGGGRVSTSTMGIAFAGKDDAAEESPDLYEERQRFWWEPPDKLREETEAAPPRRNHTTVLNGELWWTYSPEWGATSNVDLDEAERAHHGAGGGERFRPLLDPSPLITLLDFGEIGEAGGRLHVRAKPRDDLEGAPHWHMHGIGGADEVELEIERETGIVRRMGATLDGEELWHSDLEEIVLNEAFPDETFVFVPPPGEEVLPPETSRRRHYTLEEATAEAPFPVFFIPELPEGDWRLRVNYHPPRRRPPMPAHAWLIYTRPDARATISLAQRLAGEGGFGWTGYGPPPLEEAKRDGTTYTLSRADPDQGRQNTVAFERGDTSLQLQSAEIDVETLLELAATLRTVGGERQT
jgi:outer membrane lipoprotein-sorting protein